MLSIIIVFSIIISVHEYILNNGETIRVSLKSHSRYLFYIKARQYQNTDITINLHEMNSIPFNKWSFYEQNYEERNVGGSDYNNINFTKIKNETFIFFTYKPTSYRCVNFYFMIAPNIDYPLIEVKAVVNGDQYNFTNGEEKLLSNLKANNTYYLDCFPTYAKRETINVTMYMKYTKKKPFDKFYIHEYSNAGSYYNQYTINYVNYTKKGDEDLIPFSYIVLHYYTKNISFRFEPEYDIDYIKTKIGIYGGVYDFENNVKQELTNLLEGISYFLYIECISHKLAEISLTINDIYEKPFDYLYIYNSNSRVSYESSIYVLNYTEPLEFTKQKNNNYLATFSHKLYPNYGKRYICFKIKPKYNISKINAIIKLDGGMYYLENGVPQTLSSFKAGYPYYIYFEARNLQQSNIKLTFSSGANNPYEYLLIYEFSSSSPFFEKNITKYLTSNEKKSDSIIFSYMKSYNTSLIGIDLTPLYNIRITVQVDVGGGCIYLENGKSKNVTSIIKNYPYYLFIQAKDKQTVNITLSCKTDFLKELYIIEFDNQYIPKYNKNITKNLDWKKNNSEYIISFSYIASSFTTNRVAFQILPENNFDYILSKIDVGGGSYDLAYNQPLEIYKMIPGNNYHFYFKAKKNDKFQIKLFLNNINITSMHFSIIDFYEFIYRNSSEYYKNSTNIVELISENNKTYLSTSYVVSSKKANYVAFKISPECLINDLFVQIINKEKTKNKKSNTFIILIIVIPIIILIALIVIFLLIKKHRKKQNIDMSDLSYSPIQLPNV